MVLQELKLLAIYWAKQAFQMLNWCGTTTQDIITADHFFFSFFFSNEIPLTASALTVVLLRCIRTTVTFNTVQQYMVLQWQYSAQCTYYCHSSAFDVDAQTHIALTNDVIDYLQMAVSLPSCILALQVTVRNNACDLRYVLLL
jgi:hypothetical protein